MPEACAFVRQGEAAISFRDGWPLLNVLFNQTPSIMMLDTGAAATFVSADLVKRAGLQDARKVVGKTMGIGGSNYLNLALAQRMRLAGISLEDRTVVVAPFDLRGMGKPDGVLGNDVLRHYDVDLDLAGGRITFYRARNCPSGRPGWRGTFTTFAFPQREEDSNHPTIPVALDGHDMIAILDTGASSIIVDRAAAASIGVTPEALQADRKLSVGGLSDGKSDMFVHRFTSLSFGGESFASPEIGLTDLPEKSTEMILGRNVLRRHHVWISYASRRVYFAPATGG